MRVALGIVNLNPIDIGCLGINVNLTENTNESQYCESEIEIRKGEEEEEGGGGGRKEKEEEEEERPH